MVKDKQKTLESKLAVLKQSYLATLKADLAALFQVFMQISFEVQISDCTLNSDRQVVNASSKMALDNVSQRLHKIAGSAGTFGFHAVGQQARTLEVTLQSWLEASDALPASSVLKAFAQQLQKLQSEVLLDIQSRPSVVAGESAISSATVIWLIEEDFDLGNSILEQLSNFSYTVRLFSSIEQVSELSSKVAPDIVIVDVRGNLGQLASLSKLSCPLLFISEQDTFDARIHAAQMNAQGYFLKPLNIPQLVNRLEQLLNDRQAPPARIMIIDDDDQLAMYYQLVLEAAGMEVLILETSCEIMEHISLFRPEMLLMDVHMPIYNGADLAAVVRQYDEWSNLPIVFLSAETDLNKQIDTLSPGADDFLAKPILAAQLVTSVRSRIARARTLSALLNKDSLTGLLKHASIKSAAVNEATRGYRQKYPVVVAMIDIDNFKMVNDTHGHAVGDVVISSVATLLRQRLRQTDVIGRYGGEEFLIVLPHCGAEDGWKCLEDIREYFSRLSFRQGEIEFACTLSAGLVCSSSVPADERETLLVAADEALYRAKRGGRNKVSY
ncbi:diguanylate cyclase [Vreelandella neptunia]|uniref:diguanylate cyclase n=1 Tax=Vreelandella neptunia TaxID=115551 RepID=A0ABS9SBH2_9GAMM|nr:diguanylate cyclase [Halomonas neptunia]